ncbi:Respiratory nitrate reductase beta chain [[Actinomadura] parvosata subsp. kistnae]|nr:Respiratory nitrate reductase beta chain [Actinomadura parvosata subsp. kistnae]
MRVMAQVAMVMNLDKCIGCHTCSVTCKQTWTNRDGVEYVWFNNVETKPGVGYPKRYEDQERWHGGWELDRRGRLKLRAGGRVKRLLNLFANPDLPDMDDYYEPATYDYDTLINAPASPHTPVIRPKSAITGQDMAITWGANWEDDLGGAPSTPRRPQPRGHGREGEDGVRQDLHVPPAAHLRALSQPRLRGRLPVRRDVQARRGRHRPGRPEPLPRLAHVRLLLPIQEGVRQPQDRQGRKMHLLLPPHRGGTAHRVRRDLRRATALHRPHPVRRRRRPRRGPCR